MHASDTVASFLANKRNAVTNCHLWKFIEVDPVIDKRSMMVQWFKKFDKIISLSLLICLIMGHYGILCICVDSLFLKHYKSSQLPVIWLTTSFVTIVINTLYNRFNHRYSIILLLYVSCTTAMFSIILALLLYQAGFTSAIFILTFWKDTYFVVLVEMFWSFSALVVSLSSAKRTYGWMMALGTISIATAYMLTSVLTARIGTIAAVWCAVPVLATCCLLALYLYRTSADKVPAAKSKKSVQNGFQVLWNSQYLLPLFGLMMMAKISIIFIDFEFNHYVQDAYPDTDARTVFTGNVRGLISGLAMLFQLLFGFAIRIFGFSTIFLSIPLVMAATIGLHMMIPWYTIVITRITSKTLDYSFLKLCREMLYIPLNRDEKTKGKSWIDVLMFRLSGGVSSLMLMALLHIGARAYITQVTLTIQLCWFCIAFIIAHRYQKLQGLTR